MKLPEKILLVVLSLYCLMVVGCDTPKAPVNQKPLAKAIVSLAIELSSSSVPDSPKSDKCKDCNGTGIVGDGRIEVKCETCNGTGKVAMSEFDWEGFVASMKE